MHNIIGFVLIFESSKTVQYSRRHHHSKFHPKTVCSFCCTSTVSLTCFPASLPVTTVHRFHQNQSHSNQGTPSFSNTSCTRIEAPNSFAIIIQNCNQQVFCFSCNCPILQLTCAHTLPCMHFRLLSNRQQQHTVTTSGPCPARPGFESPCAVLKPSSCELLFINVFAPAYFSNV
jgi:hypothetical protein